MDENDHLHFQLLSTQQRIWIEVLSHPCNHIVPSLRRVKQPCKIIMAEFNITLGKHVEKAL